MDLRPLLQSPAVCRARAEVHAADRDTVREQMALASISAPPGDEGERGRALLRRFAALGLAEVRTDGAGNVRGLLPAGGAEAGGLLVAAHLDTVFPRETPLQVRREGARWRGPGVADNARGLAAMLAVARALVSSGARPAVPVEFIGTVGEEGAGDLRGAKALFAEGEPAREATGFVALDGCGLRQIVHRALGARRLRVEIRGAGGHSWGSRRAPNPLHALADGVAGLRAATADVPGPHAAAATRAGGGSSINAVPECAWAELDLRSEDTGALEQLVGAARRCFADAVAAENRRAAPGSAPLSLHTVPVGDRPAGATSPSAPLVRAAVAATRQIGATPELVASSTDANVPMALGIPAIAVGAGGRCGGTHSASEWFDNRNGAAGVERALLLILAAAGLSAA